jgi:hypothetical protein
VCRGEAATHPRQRFGGKRIRYQHYLSELARKPQAAPELVAELGEPYGAPETAPGCWPGFLGQ